MGTENTKERGDQMKPQSETFYKVLDPGRRCMYGKGSWPPPGEWLEVKGELVVCKNGLHLCRRGDLVEWLGFDIVYYNPTNAQPGTTEIWTAEYEGERLDRELVDYDDKIVVRKARLIRRLDNWDTQTAGLFILDCAERVLSLFEKTYPNEKRYHDAILAARQYVLGRVADRQLYVLGGVADRQLYAAMATTWKFLQDILSWEAKDEIAERKWKTDKLFEYLD